jgi:Uncharacterised nucleotidyltransferase
MRHITVSPEMRLLLACARWFAGTAGAEEVESAMRALGDYDSFMRLARVHWMEPLAAWSLKTNCGEFLDPNFVADLDRVLRQNTAGHLRLQKELLDVINILGDNQIDALPLKGPVLATMLCEEVAWRDSSDLDLLVRRTDITRARDALVEHGYRYDSQLPPSQERAAFHYRSQIILVNDRSGIAVDLHWQVVASAFPSARYFESVWERIEPALFEHHEILTFCPEDQLLFLCAHAARHSWASLRLAVDIARLIHVRPALDWDSIIHRGRGCDGRLVLALGLWMVNQLLGLEFQRPAAQYVSSILETAFASQMIDHLLNGSAGKDGRLWDFWLELKLADGWWPKVRCAAARALLPTDADGQSLILPPSLYFLYYVYRPVRLALKHIAHFLRRFLAAPSVVT